MTTALIFGRYLRELKINLWIVFVALVYVVLVIKLTTLWEIEHVWFFGIYSLLTSLYILSRFGLAYFYNPQITASSNYFPTVSFITPAKNEEDYIAATLRAMLRTDYPKGRFEIITINDGSTDNTLFQMQAVQAEANLLGIPMKVVNWERNQGKRQAMAAGVRLSQSEIIVFVDSDSFVEPDTLKEMVKYLVDPSVGAVSGHADVYNRSTNLLTKMQAIRYYVAFKAYKRAEALFGTVTCCSGCCSAYRRQYVMEVLEPWLNQRFLGTPCTYGDDRSLTNYIIRNYRSFYAPNAHSSTIVPDNWEKFFRQQLRWKKSWTRESLRACLIMWRKNPIMTVSFLLGLILPLMAPAVVFRALIWLPGIEGIMPWVYISGLILMSVIYGLYYFIHTRDRLWVYGVAFAWFYPLILIWQLPYAILTIRDGRWGTR